MLQIMFLPILIYVPSLAFNQGILFCLANLVTGLVINGFRFSHWYRYSFDWNNRMRCLHILYSIGKC